ncbi:MAG: hypothetical protein HYS81_03260 [Candidatus Aenigmatarchaeota archaeon]|nr:MAG: hypothetical protein HYS81_03260 [Candidatus Aenigmarchaeota archaeon]
MRTLRTASGDVRRVGQSTVFNAVIEGKTRRNHYHLDYKIAHLEVPSMAAALLDGKKRFSFYGSTRDFSEMSSIGGAEGTYEINMPPLATCPGVVVPFVSAGIPGVARSMESTVIERRLETPLAVMTRDGRVFVEDDARADGAYLEILETGGLAHAGKLFKNPEMVDVWEIFGRNPKTSNARRSKKFGRN